MNTDPNKWVNTLPNTGSKFRIEENKLDPNVWVSTLPKVNLKNPIKKYSIAMILFFVGIVFVSVIKNETRYLQKEINNLQISIDSLNFDLHQATLDYEVITSPENISKLAREYLEQDLYTYEKSQIRHIDQKAIKLAQLSKNKIDKHTSTKNTNSKENLKLKLEKKIDKTKTELKKLQEIYSNPKTLPDEIKSHVAKRIEKKKTELKKLVSEPKDVITLQRVQNWATVQLVKVFLGIPVVPGR